MPQANTGAALLPLWVKCVSAERGHGSKSRVHFLGYSLKNVWVKMWVNCLTHTVTHTRKCADRFKEYRRGGFAPSPVFRILFLLT